MNGSYQCCICFVTHLCEDMWEEVSKNHDLSISLITEELYKIGVVVDEKCIQVISGILNLAEQLIASGLSPHKVFRQARLAASMYYGDKKKRGCIGCYRVAWRNTPVEDIP